MSTDTLSTCARAAANALVAAEDEIEHLDRAIGDGDHFHNMKRGADAVLAILEDAGDKPASEVMKAIGMKLMSTVGGASGPLSASFFLACAKSEGIDAEWTPAVVAAMVRDGTEAVRQRGKANRGDKTMVDVLLPVSEALEAADRQSMNGTQIAAAVRAAAGEGVASTKDIKATKGRAAFLGERAVGHIDPGAKSCAVMTVAICDALFPEVPQEKLVEDEE